jgi:hypothetical protein
MVNKLSELVTGEQVAIWLIIAFLVGYFIYKEYPELKRRISKSALKEQKDELSEKTISDRIDAIEKKLDGMEKKFDEMNDKLSRDYDRINVMEKQQKKIERMQRNSLEERGIIMRALLALMEGSPENDKIQESEKEIQDYLVKQSHAQEEE